MLAFIGSFALRFAHWYNYALNHFHFAKFGVFIGCFAVVGKPVRKHN
jgi:hypothetical protein